MDVENVKTLLLSTAAQYYLLGRQYSALTKSATDYQGEWLLDYLARSTRWNSRNIRAGCFRLQPSIQMTPLVKLPEWIHAELGFYVAETDLEGHWAVIDTALHLTAQLTDALRLCRDHIRDPVAHQQIQYLVDIDIEFQSHLAHALTTPLQIIVGSKLTASTG